MPDGILSFDHGEVRLGNTLVPGILKSLSIAGRVRFDEAKVDALSGKAKTPMGWEDSDIHIEMAMLSDDESDCYKKLAQLNAIFQGHDNGENPKVYDVVNAHVRARGINHVVFSGLDSNESDEDDVIVASLNFVEHLPPKTRPESQVAASDKAKGGATASKKKDDPDLDQEIQKEPGPFGRRFNAGIGIP